MRPFRLPQLGGDANAPFPDPARAWREPDGLLCFGGDLSPTRLLNAYAHGIFPWFSAGQPILWWSPDPRMVIRPDQLHLSRRFRRELRLNHSHWTLSADCAFEAVIEACSRLPRRGQHGTWITAAMLAAYTALHRLGHAHSVEVWEAGVLVGGIYGVAIGRVFFGESMFSLKPGGSKVAIAALCRELARWNYALLDGQVESEHLSRLGFETISRSQFLDCCATHARLESSVPGSWRDDFLLGSAAMLAAPSSRP